jgi:hypothetical protein
LVVTWAYNAGTNTATASGAGSTNFAALVAADTAGGWGKFTADASGTQIIIKGRIVIGDWSNATAFVDTNKEIIIANGFLPSNGCNIFYVISPSSFTLGTLTDAAKHTTTNGCSIQILEATRGNNFLIYDADSNPTIGLYSCLFSGVKATYPSNILLLSYGASSSNTQIYNCLLTKNMALSYYTQDVDIYNSQVQSTINAFVGTSGTINRLSITDTYVALYNFYSGLVFLSPYLRSNTFTIYASEDSYIVNADTDAWSMDIDSGTAKVYRQYEFDLTTDTSATVTLKDNTNTNVFSVTSDGTTGAIATQTVSRGYYAQATGDTLQDYAPFTLTITKSGKDTHTETLTLTEKTKLQITLETPVTPDYSKPTWAITKQEYDKIVKDEAEPYMMATAVLLLQRQRDKRMIKALQK